MLELTSPKVIANKWEDQIMNPLSEVTGPTAAGYDMQVKSNRIPTIKNAWL